MGYAVIGPGQPLCEVIAEHTHLFHGCRPGEIQLAIGIEQGSGDLAVQHHPGGLSVILLLICPGAVPMNARLAG
jgi:hypothetical protein